MQNLNEGTKKPYNFYFIKYKKYFNYRIIEIAGGREVFSQSRSKAASRKPRFLSASNSSSNEDARSNNKLALKKNNKSPNRQSVWELRNR